jgi:nitrite reductase/ring-hydroxylating ferredoxin subunit
MIIRNMLLWLGLGLLLACGKDTPVPAIPYVVVNEQLNLTNIQYNNLRYDNGYVYLDNTGVRGIIVIRRGPNRYVALERNCTYQPADACARVEVDASGLFLIDPCCQSQFDLSGQVLARPATYPLRQYATATSGNFLYITN